MGVPRLILGSASPRRLALLKALRLSFEVVAADVDEASTETDPAAFASEVARRKALAVAGRVGDARRLVLAADTIVVLDGEILGKPRDRADAEAMLGRLSGRTHVVFTAVSLMRPPDTVVHEETVRTEVTMKALSAAEIRGYVASGEPLDKAGAYAAQGLGMFLVREVRGSYTNVVGLPICEVVEALVRHQVIDLFPVAEAG